MPNGSDTVSAVPKNPQKRINPMNPQTDLTNAAELALIRLYSKIEPYADMSGAYMSGADMSGADMSGANLSGAYLTGAYLSDAYLSDANLTNVDFTSAKMRLS